MSRRIRRAAVIGFASAAVLGACASSTLARNAYVANSSSNDVSVFDTATGRLLGGLTVPNAEYGALAITPDGRRAYVVDGNSDSVSVIDTATNLAVAGPIAVGDYPAGVAITPDGRLAYVTNSSSDSVSVIDTATNQVVGAPIAVGNGPYDIVITRDGRRAYVANYNSGGSISVIDTATNQAIGSTIAVGDGPEGMAITPDGKRLYVANLDSKNISMIDTATNAVVGAPITVGSSPYNLAITPDGKRAYVANYGSANISVIDIGTNQVVGAPIAVGTRPWGIAITPDGRRAYVANSNIPGAVTTIDTATDQVVGAPIAVGDDPDAVAIVPDQPPRAGLTTRASGHSATFDGSGSTDPDGKTAAFSWDFGDGSSAQTTAPSVSHTYEKVGAYKATLTVTDDEGCSTTLIFTGQTASCDGSSVAAASRLLAAVTLGRLKRDRKKGTATLIANVPGPGTLDLSGKRVLRLRPRTRQARLAKTVKAGSGPVKLRIKARGKARRTLNRRGSVKVRVTIAYTPLGGDPNIQTLKVKLIKRG